MGVTLGGEALFESGPASVEAGGLELRAAELAGLEQRGVRVVSQGRSARRLVQRGVLMGDDPEALRQQMEAIEAKLDGVPRALVDELERTWPSVVMLSFRSGLLIRAGARWKAAYQVDYVEVE